MVAWELGIVVGVVWWRGLSGAMAVGVGCGSDPKDEEDDDMNEVEEDKGYFCQEYIYVGIWLDRAPKIVFQKYYHP